MKTSIPFSDFYKTIKKKGVFASDLECSHVYLWQIAKGKRRPSPQLAMAIETATQGHVSAIELLGLDKKAAA